MSEKRFYELISSIDYYQIWDKQEDKGYTIEDAVDKLNSLAEENEQLRQTTKTQQIRIYCQDKEIQKLNEQLNKIPNTIKEVWIE